MRHFNCIECGKPAETKRPAIYCSKTCKNRALGRERTAIVRKAREEASRVEASSRE